MEQKEEHRLEALRADGKRLAADLEATDAKIKKVYIVDQIVKAHGGRVDVSSIDQGTTFTVTLGRDGALPAEQK